ncbi:toxin HipA, partial [Klebsiella michiganensis]
MAMIGVYADWDGLHGPRRLGFLHSRRTRARELFEFEYDPDALADPELNFLQLDPEIILFGGAQYP